MSGCAEPGPQPLPGSPPLFLPLTLSSSVKASPTSIPLQTATPRSPFRPRDLTNIHYWEDGPQEKACTVSGS